MEDWEFLLQKEGERSWQQIESPKIEIEAGRYRVVAHSSRTNADVEICVTHHSTEEFPPKRRSQKRSRRTNPEGLMVVIPFTYLKPGLWELRCGGDIMADFLGKSWQHAIQLQVLPKPTEVLPAAQPASSVVDSTPSTVQADLSENLTSSSAPDLAVETAPIEIETPSLTPVTTASAVPVPEDIPLESQTNGKAVEEFNSSTLDAASEIPLESQTNSKAAQEFNSSTLEAASEIPLESQTNGKAAQDFNSFSLGAESEIPLESQTNGKAAQDHNSSTLEAQPEIPVKSEIDGDEHQPFPITFVNVDLPIPLELAESDNNQVAFSPNLGEVATPTNPILEQSLQMLEQILQQVLEPVLEEFDPSESSESQSSADLDQTPETPESELPLERQGLILTLEEDALVTRRGEPLTITGKVDVLDVNQWNGSETASTLNSVFRGTLRYQLRDPQTSQALLDVRQALPEQALPLAFNHTLEIPPDCQTRLFLGKVTLYGSTPVALTSQPFTITADLDELLETIIPGTKVVPMAKMLALTNKFASLQDNEVELEELAEDPLERVVLDLIEPSQSQDSLPLQPASQKPLPPQIYQPTATPKGSKSLQLPNFPKKPSAATSAESSAVEVKLEDTVEQSVGIANDLSPETPNPLPAETAEDTLVESRPQETVQQSEDGTLQEDAVIVADSSFSALDATQLSDSSDTINSPWDTSTETEILEHSELTADSQLGTSDAEPIAWVNATELEQQSAEVQSTKPSTDEPTAVDNAFQALKLQDRFWLRLNSLAADAELSKWLESDLSPPPNTTEVEEVTPPLNAPPNTTEVEEVTPPLNAPQAIAEVEEVTPPLNAPQAIAEVEEVTQFMSFDESMWDESEQFGSEAANTTELQPPSQENTSLDWETLEQLQLVGVGDEDWADQEIVVEDEDIPAPEQPMVKDETPKKVPLTELINSKPEARMPASPQLNLPLPAPSIFVPTSELTAGEPMIVRVKLPPHQARLCVKLWVQDRQSRYLLDGPRWLVDLFPDSAGQLEAMTQVVIPFGSAEVRFEAIAIDLDSQRESHKVALDCVVVPPDLPSISLDEFQA